ncbi:CDP-alcohol phosphatidyltransferase family protein [[Eubacterium] cellulosolvens]
MITALRNRVNTVLTRIALSLDNLGFTPNMLTVIGFICALMAGALFYMKINWIFTYVVAPFLILLSGLMDALDGPLARIGTASKFGGILDSTFDRLGEILIFLGMILGELASPFWGITAISFSLMVSYVRARTEMENIKMESIGIAERPERMLILIISSFLWVIEYGVALIAILSIITFVQRIVYSYQHVR